jgi:uncharacterized protein YjbI with pentapeptide repeats
MPIDDEEKKSEKNEKKDFWDMAKIVGSFFTAVVIAFATVFGSIFIPREISRQSLESQKIIELSQLVPQLYDSTRALKPTVIAMASYGAPAVDFLLLALDNATECKNDSMVNAIIATMKYMDNDSKKEIQVRLKMEINQLNDKKLVPHNLKYISNIIEILSSSALDGESMRILARYFSKVSIFNDNKYELQKLNGLVLRAIADNNYPIHRLKLTNLDFEDEKLRGIDFGNADLTSTNMSNCDIIGCDFEGATLDSCSLYGAKFFHGYEDSLEILNTFRNFAKSRWERAELDDEIVELLEEIKRDDNINEELLQLAINIRDASIQ